jgi:hypothetical protein
MSSCIKTILSCIGVLLTFTFGFATESISEKPENVSLNIFILVLMDIHMPIMNDVITKPIEQTSMINTIQKVMFAFTE